MIEASFDTIRPNKTGQKRLNPFFGYNILISADSFYMYPVTTPIAGGECEDWWTAPSGVEVLSERHQFLLFAPDDDFWECLHLEAADRVEGSFKIWVWENGDCPR